MPDFEQFSLTKETAAYAGIAYVYSDNFIHAKTPIQYKEKIFTKKELEKHRIRKLTPQEAFALQGFDSIFYDKAKNAGVSDHQLLKQAGNAVSVNTVYAILHHLLINQKLINR